MIVRTCTGGDTADTMPHLDLRTGTLCSNLGLHCAKYPRLLSRVAPHLQVSRASGVPERRPHPTVAAETPSQPPPPRFPRPPTLTDAFSRVAGRRGRSERAKQNEPLPGLNNRAPGPKRAAHSFPTYAGREPTRTQWAPLRPTPLCPPDRCSTAHQIMLDPSGRAGCKGKVRGSVYQFRW